LYTEEGNIEAAAAIQRKVEWNRRNNPYYLHHLAEVATEEQRWADAIDLLNRAIRLEAREYRFHYALARAQHYAGNAEVARSSLERARELARANGLEEPLSLPDES
jgi:Flp pilus assembly protein TadD